MMKDAAYNQIKTKTITKKDITKAEENQYPTKNIQREDLESISRINKSKSTNKMENQIREKKKEKLS